MPTPQPANAALAAFWDAQLGAPAVKQTRIHEAVIAHLLAGSQLPALGSGSAAVKPRISVDLDQLAAVATAGLHLEASGDGTTLTIWVANPDGSETEPWPAAQAEPYQPVGDPAGAQWPELAGDPSPAYAHNPDGDLS